MVTQDQLKAALFYNPDTGVFIRKTSSGGYMAGIEAGCVKNLSNKLYRVIGINKGEYLAHRLAWLYMYGEWPRHCIDHINGNTQDNRIINLRDVTIAENNKNISGKVNSTGKVFGVAYKKHAKKYCASIYVNKKCVHLGYFANYEDAVVARLDAQDRYGFHENHGAKLK